MADIARNKGKVIQPEAFDSDDQTAACNADSNETAKGGMCLVVKSFKRIGFVEKKNNEKFVIK